MSTLDAPPSAVLAPSPRSRLHRRAHRGSHERAVIDPILDEALVCHVGFLREGAPCVIPTSFVRVADAIYLHGAAGSHMLAALASGADLSIAVTLLDGLVLSRTAFHHSVNYRSVVLFGRAVAVDDPAAKRRAMDALLDKLEPGRSAACRPPSDAELGATRVIALPLTEASAKIRSGPPLADHGEDAALPHWAGVIPIQLVRCAPVPAPDVQPAGG